MIGGPGPCQIEWSWCLKDSSSEFEDHGELVTGLVVVKGEVESDRRLTDRP